MRLRVTRDESGNHIVMTCEKIKANYIIGMLPADRDSGSKYNLSPLSFLVRFPSNIIGRQKALHYVMLLPGRYTTRYYHEDLRFLQNNPYDPNCILEGWLASRNDDQSENFKVVVKSKRVIKADEILSVDFGDTFRTEDLVLEKSSTPKKTPKKHARVDSVQASGAQLASDEVDENGKTINEIYLSTFLNCTLLASIASSAKESVQASGAQLASDEVDENGKTIKEIYLSTVHFLTVLF